jgi:hypothetical protein
VSLGFEVRPAGFQEGEVAARDQVDPSRRAIGIQARKPAAVHPEAEVRPALPCSQQHFFVIAQDRNKAATVAQGNQLFDHPLAVDAAVHEVAQWDKHVVRLRCNQFDQLRQGRGTAVDVSDGDGTGHGGSGLPWNCRHLAASSGGLWVTKLQYSSKSQTIHLRRQFEA